MIQMAASGVLYYNNSGNNEISTVRGIDVNEQVVGTKEAARRLGVSVRTIQLWVENGSLEAWKTSGGHRRISESSLQAVLQQRNEPTDQVITEQCDVLIVEDDLTMQAYYRALFEILKPNANLKFAQNGFEGLIALGKYDPALVIVDVDMPGMNGVEMISSVDRLSLCDNVKLVVITALSNEQILKRGTLPDDVQVFPKPINVDDLRGLVKDDQRRRRAQS